MTNVEPWRLAFQTEIELAVSARLRGNEGMARVCARRAAGVIAGEYLTRTGAFHGSANAYEKIRMLTRSTHLPNSVREICSHFTLRATRAHTLPLAVDLIEEARLLKQLLLDGLEG